MKFLIAICGFFIPTLVSAVVIQSPAISNTKYTQYLGEHRKESLIAYFQTRINEEPSFNERLIETSDLSKIVATKVQIENPDRPAITRYTLEFLKNFAERSLDLQKSKAAKDILCFATVLLDQNTTSCPIKDFQLQDFTAKLPDYQTLMIEGVSFSFKSMLTIQLLPTQKYRFTVLSNSRKPIQFFGTWEEFIQQATPQELWVQGDCENFQTRIEDMSLRLRSEVLFPNCVQSTQQAEELKPPQTWMQRNKKWVYLSGALLVGAGVYALKDKKLVIDRSGF